MANRLIDRVCVVTGSTGMAEATAHRIAAEAAGPVAMAVLQIGRRGSDNPRETPLLFSGDGVMVAADLTIHDWASMPDAPTEAEALAALLDRGGPEALGALHADFALACWRHGRLQPAAR